MEEVGATKKKRLEAKLRKEYNCLDNHWEKIKGVKLNQQQSDNNYKHHVFRLMSTYTRSAKNIDNKSQPISRAVKPVTKLYGIKGLRGTQSAEELRRKEAGWEGRVDISEKLDTLNKKKDISRIHSEGQLHCSTAPTATASCNPTNKSALEMTKSSSLKSDKKTKEKKKSRRADFDGISENDLIANGLYAFTPKQMNVFNAFAEMLSSFDNADMIHILEDALEEAKQRNGLEDYSGFAE